MVHRASRENFSVHARPTAPTGRGCRPSPRWSARGLPACPAAPPAVRAHQQSSPTPPHPTHGGRQSRIAWTARARAHQSPLTSSSRYYLTDSGARGTCRGFPFRSRTAVAGSWTAPFMVACAGTARRTGVRIVLPACRHCGFVVEPQSIFGLTAVGVPGVSRI